MPIGYVITTLLLAGCTLLVVAPQRRPPALADLSFRFALVLNELPFVAIAWLLAATLLAWSEGDLTTPVGWTAFGIAVLTTVGLAVIAWRGLRAGPAIDRAMGALDAATAAGWRQPLPIGRILFAPFLVRRRDVERVKDISYGDAGRDNLLDVYRPRFRPADGPTLVYLHGGRFRSGRKDREARPLIYRLASRGWVCVSANYRLGSAATFPDSLIDAKHVIAWVREHGQDLGADPTTVFVAGSSAGGHLAATAALTPGDPAFQPGFESADTSVTAAIGFYGYYGSLDAEVQPSSPSAYVRPDAPPFFVAHGDGDTVVLVEGAREFVDRVRSESEHPVVYVELPGAQHGFDLFHSLRFERVVDAVEAFAAWVLARDAR